jgi:hypothetical protein
MIWKWRNFIRIYLLFLKIISWSCTIVINWNFDRILIILILRNRTKFLLFWIIIRLRINQFCMSAFILWHWIIKWFQLKSRCQMNSLILRFLFFFLKIIITIIVSLFYRNFRPWFWSCTWSIDISSFRFI